MILSYTQIEEIAAAVTKDFNEFFFGERAAPETHYAQATPIDWLATDYLGLRVSYARLTGCFQRFSELSKIRDFRRKRVYVLTNYNSTHEQDLYRVDILRRMGFDPYVMIYERPTAPPITRHLQRWVNNKRIFRTVEHFADYEPVKKLGRDG